MKTAREWLESLPEPYKTQEYDLIGVFGVEWDIDNPSPIVRRINDGSSLFDQIVEPGFVPRHYRKFEEENNIKRVLFSLMEFEGSHLVPFMELPKGRGDYLFRQAIYWIAVLELGSRDID